jgi:predicted Zn-dependent protease
MKELVIHELDERLQKQVQQARDALTKAGVDYVLQVCVELLKKHPSAYEVRGLLWEALRSTLPEKPSLAGRLRNNADGWRFKFSTRSLLKKDPLELIHRCDETLLKKQLHTEVFLSLEKASRALGWIENQVLACRAVIELKPELCLHRLSLAKVLLLAKRPLEAIEHLEWILAKEPTSGEAQTLLKNASVAETLQRGNWEDTTTNFHSKTKDGY